VQLLKSAKETSCGTIIAFSNRQARGAQMSIYTQLVHEQRYQIYALLKAGHNQSEIAHVIGVHKSTISRELSRNKGLRGYRPKQAQTFAQQRQFAKANNRISTETWLLVEKFLIEDWSPEQISSWLKIEQNITVSHERIYQYVLHDKKNGGTLYTHLRCKK
jgi:transposase, IS30 family